MTKTTERYYRHTGYPDFKFYDKFETGIFCLQGYWLYKATVAVNINSKKVCSPRTVYFTRQCRNTLKLQWKFLYMFSWKCHTLSSSEIIFTIGVYLAKLLRKFNTTPNILMAILFGKDHTYLQRIVLKLQISRSLESPTKSHVRSVTKIPDLKQFFLCPSALYGPKARFS